MSPLHRYLALIVMAFGLSSCDSTKTKLIAFLDEKIEETGGEAMPGEEAGAQGEPSPGSLPGGVQSPVRKISDADYAEFIKTPGHVVVVDFYADWCGPCKRLAPILESIADDNRGKVVLGKMDVDQNRETPGKLGVRGIPDVRIYVDGKQVDKFVGLMPEQVVRQKIESHIGKEPGAAPQPQPKPQPKPQSQPKPQPKPEPEAPKEEPKIKPMEKDWLPPGVQKKGS